MKKPVREGAVSSNVGGHAMTNDMKKDAIQIALSRRQLLQAAGAGAAAAAFSGLGAPAMAQEKVELTMWAWTPDTQSQIDLFTKAFPHISVKLENAGQGPAEYVKLRNAIQAGTGLPDVGQVEFTNIPGFRQLEALLDMGQYGANDVRDKFIDWTWTSASDGAAVYGIPWDSGPMGILYRADVLDAHKIEVPKTWAAFAESSKALSKASPDTFLTNFGGTADGGWVIALLAQAGWKPFELKGTDLKLNLNDAIAKKWAAYWQDLIDAKAVGVKTPVWTTDWFTGLDEGTYASWMTGAWGAVFIPQFAKKSNGHWRAAPLPQWDAGKYVTANLGGSTFATFKTTKHPKEATQLAVFLGADPQTARLWNTKQFLFPVLKELVSDPELINHKYDLYGGQAVNEVFVEAAKHVDSSFQYAPFQDYLAGQVQQELSASIGGKGSLSDAFDRLQAGVSAYCADQGYTVSNG
ncbi:extracellular solute-binding protein [Rhizobium sp. P44RR-XXIV]|nr:extracellular solute-binding protein [Rhizobium sp. P44RR-XXIV]